MVNLKCIICNTSFPNAKMVKDHITTHLTGLPHPCDKCEYSFDTQQQLEEHEVKHVQYVSQEEEDEEMAEENSGEEEYEADEYIVPDQMPSGDAVRKSARNRSIKNYAQFLKDELGSDDSESNLGEADDDNDPDVVLPTKVIQTTAPAESIKPVVRSEGTKVYQRKGKAPNDQSTAKAPQAFSPRQQLPTMANEADISQQVSLENLGISQQIVNEMPNKKFIEMKIGEKIVRVKKLMMTKAEIEAMAKEGKITMKGNTLLLKNEQLSVLQKTPSSGLRQVPAKAVAAAKAAAAAANEASPNYKPSVRPINIEAILGQPKAAAAAPQKQVAKKTYVPKKPNVADGAEEMVEEETFAAVAAAVAETLKSEQMDVKEEMSKEERSSRRASRRNANEEKVLVESAETIEGQNIGAA